MPTKLVQLKVTLLGTKPPVWRRILVPATYPLQALSVILQQVMGWDGGHLHQFRIGGTFYGDPRLLDDPGVVNEDRVSVGKVLAAKGARGTYEYDFGDGWEHTLLVEQIAEITEKKPRATCLAGARACPPEDCGGPYGFADLLAIFEDPQNPQYEEMIENYGEYDPNGFAVEETNARLTAIQR